MNEVLFLLVSDSLLQIFGLQKMWDVKNFQVIKMLICRPQFENHVFCILLNLILIRIRIFGYQPFSLVC